MEGIPPELRAFKPDSLAVYALPEVRLLPHQQLLLQDVGAVTEFCLAEPLLTHILLAVDVYELIRKMSHELTVDDGVCSLISHISLLHADIESVVVDRTSISEGHQFAVHPDGAA